MSSLSLPNNLSLTHPPSTRQIVDIRLYFFKIFSIIEKHSFSVSFNLNSSDKLLDEFFEYNIFIIN